MLKAFFGDRFDPVKVKEELAKYGIPVPDTLREKDYPNLFPVAVAALQSQGKIAEAEELKKKVIQLREPDIKKPKWLNITGLIIPIMLAFATWFTTTTINAWAVPEVKEKVTQQEQILTEQRIIQSQQKALLESLSDQRLEEKKTLEGHLGRLYQASSRIEKVEKKLDELILENQRLRLEVEALRKGNSNANTTTVK